MSTKTTASREDLIQILDNLRDERVSALLEYAEFLLRRQMEEDAADIADSESALKEGETVSWEEVKKDINSRVQD